MTHQGTSGQTLSARRLGTGESQLWRAAVELLVPADDRDHQLIPTDDAERALADLRCYMIVAEANSTITGLLSAYRFPDLEAGGQLVYLYDIEVAASRRRQGIGRTLVQELLRCCDADDVDLIWAGTEATNNAARVLFEKTGASLQGESYAEYEWNLED